MDAIELKYLTIRDKIKKMSDQLKDYRKVLNETAEVLLNSRDVYEFVTEDLVLSKPTTHKLKKKPKE
ncbi:MAG: hypothetical protein GY760_03125 [Deltaproteobacteria bacterium]|nr:hypothetical protein [Deltaproteobacteria bacterium]